MKLQVAAEPALVIKTTWGEIRITARDGKIVSCGLPFQPLEKLISKISNTWNPPAIHGSRVLGRPNEADSRALVAADHFIRALFAGDAAPLPPVAISDAAPFTQAVWKVLLSIPFGQTLGYSEVAKAAKRPRAARAAGSACGANLIPLFIPCHRVLATGGGLGGFSGGLAWKKFLLRCEGHAP